MSDGAFSFSLAAVMAAKLAYPERQCVNVTGDAGVGYVVTCPAHPAEAVFFTQSY